MVDNVAPMFFIFMTFATLEYLFILYAVYIHFLFFGLLKWLFVCYFDPGSVEHHFPLFGVEEDDEFMDETIDQWMGEWIDQTYHPLLDQISVYPMAIANHDIQPTDYGDLVALIYWLATINPSPPNLVCGQAPNLIWDRESKDEFRFMPILIYLEGMNLQPPLNYLPGLIRSVLHQTDTFFLDACPLCGGFSGPDFAWTVENFIWFRDDWQKAKPIYEGNQELIKWSNNTERLVKISQILRKAHLQR